MIGVYLHIPFCAQKCPYCDFYSTKWRIDAEERFLAAMKREISRYAAENIAADTLYFGGGTPSLIRPQTIAALIQSVKEIFLLSDDAEITLECNPCTVTPARAAAWKEAGVNRVSLGMQSANAEELKLLGRRHTPTQVKTAVDTLQSAGIHNLSLDLMLAVPRQTRESLQNTLDFAVTLPVQHISAYLLQIEPGTPFAGSPLISDCPSEDDAAVMYLQTVETLKNAGFAQYEISNFARAGFESRHNLKYWRCEEYLGFGSAAHSFFHGKRFCYPESLKAFTADAPQVEVTLGGSAEEYAMLRLRLSEGVSLHEFSHRGGDASLLQKRAEKFRQAGLLTCEADRVALTEKGFLLSNTVIGDLLF